uniref:SUN domain-containing protein n=1 Tax=Panagrellus redivivus TaxID=6233 RepID=A0A7E4V2C7_PANRE
MKVRYLLSLIFGIFVLPCIQSAPAVPPAASTQPPVFQIAQKLLSNIGRFPTAIQEGMTGKTGEIRKIVSSALGGGLIGQLVENPILAAGNFGIDLDQFGINKTMLEKSMGVDGSVQNNLLPMTNKGELLFSNQLTSPAPSTPAKPEPLYIDGQIVRPENEQAVLTAILGEEERRSAPSSLNNNRAPAPGGRQRPAAQQSSSGYYDSNTEQFYKGQNQKKAITRRPMYLNNNYKDKVVVVTPSPVVPAPPPTTTTPSPPEDLLSSVMPFFNTPKIVPTEEYIDAFDSPNSVVEAVNRVNSGNGEIRRAPMATTPSYEMDAMQAKLVSLEKTLNDRLEMLAKQHNAEKDVKVEKILETIKFGKTSRLSALQKSLRYSPSMTHDDLRLDTHPLSVVPPSECTCVPVKLNNLKGRWVQVLGSTALSARLESTIGALFNTTPTGLDCGQVQISPERDFEPAYAHFVWGFRLSKATNVVRLPGNIFASENDQLTMRIVDFNDEITDIPLCIHKADERQRYLVISASDRCREAALLVKSPEEFFRNTDAELTSFLQKKISEDEIDRMELVEHVDACSAAPK